MSVPDSTQRCWTVLLIGGVSGAGKTVVARQLGLAFGVSWLQVDDLRLALQHSRAALPDAADTAALRLFWDTPNVWQCPPEQLCDGLIAVAQAISAAIEIVVTNHVETAAPAVLEGDGIVPALLARPMLRSYVQDGRVRAVFIVEADETTLLANMLARSRGLVNRTEAELQAEARAKWLYGQWLTREAQHYGLPVLAPRPWPTLAGRIIAAVAGKADS